MIDQAVVFGQFQNLVGTMTAPASRYDDEGAGETANVAAIFLNAGMLHHAGPFRLHVDLARTIANYGISSLRFDLSGIGESLGVGAGGRSIDRAANETSQAMDFMFEAYGIEKFILFGLCSGADDSVHTALKDSRVVGVVAMDGCGYATAKFYKNRAIRHYLPRLCSPAKWQRLLSRWFGGNSDTPSSLQLGTDVREFPSRDQAAREFQQLVDRGVQMHFTYTGGIADYYNYEQQFFEIESDSDDEVVIATRMSLRTLDSKDRPYLKIEGTGTIRFSRKAGLVSSYEFKETYEKNEGNDRTRVPVTITATREEEAALRQRILTRAQQMAVSAEKNARAAAAKPVETPEDKLNTLLAKIAEDKEKKRSPSGNLYALERLTVIEARKADVEEIILEELSASDFGRQLAGVKAAAKWGGKKSVEKLCELTTAGNTSVAHEAIRALGVTRSAEAIPALVESLRAGSAKSSYASRSLIQIGPACEEPVIELLIEKDRTVFRYVCDVLPQVGSQKSAAALETLLADEKDFGRKSAASRAMGEAKKRAANAQAVPNSQGLSPAELKVAAALAKLEDESADATAKVRALNDIQGVKPIEKLNEDVETALLKVLDGEDQNQRASAVSALRTWATARSTEAMLKLAAQPAFSGRTTAVDILQRLAEIETSGQLASLTSDPLIRTWAYRALQKTGLTEEAEKTLLEKLKNADAATRTSIIGLLAQHGTEASLAALEASSPPDEEVTREFAETANAIARIRVRVGLTPVE